MQPSQFYKQLCKYNKIMTPKEKAEDLVLTYLRIDNNTKEWFNKHIAKQCALITVDEILELTGGHINQFYKQVKTELTNL